MDLNGSASFYTQVHKTLLALYPPLDGITNLKYKLLCFFTPNKIIF